MFTNGQELNAQVDAGNERQQGKNNAMIKQLLRRWAEDGQKERRAPDGGSQAMYRRMIARARKGRKERRKREREKSNPFHKRPCWTWGKVKVNKVKMVTGNSTPATVDNRKRKVSWRGRECVCTWHCWLGEYSTVSFRSLRSTRAIHRTLGLYR